MRQSIVVHKPGGYEVLKVCDQPDLVPESANDVIVQVTAIGINYADICVRWGLYESAKKYVGWPITPGFEFSGVVAKVGKQVTKFQEGDDVFGVTRFNAYSSQVRVPDTLLFAKPPQLSYLEAATFPVAFLTAYHGLFQLLGPLSPGAALIHSGAGGVGGALCQLAKLRQQTVVSVVGGANKVDYAKSMGADLVIDKSQEDLWKLTKERYPNGFQLVCDANGYSTLKRGYQQLAPMGKLLIYGFHSMLPKKGGRVNWLKLALRYLQTPRFNPLDLTGRNASLIAFNLSYLFEREDLLGVAMQDLLRMLEKGQIQPHQVKGIPFARVAESHQELESGKTIGKLALEL